MTSEIPIDIRAAPSVSGGAAQGSDLAGKAAQGDPEALASACSLVSRVIQFRGYAVPEDERPDVVQNAMIDILRALRSRRFSDDEQFRGFVRTVTYRRCIDWMRERRRRERLKTRSAEVATPRGILLAKERQQLATRVVSHLRKPCRDIFGLHIGLGMTYGQVARRIGRSEGAVRTQAYECMKQARQLLNRMERQKTVGRQRRES